jgi:hypothetical protein
VLFRKVLNWGKEEAEKLLRIRSFEDPICKWKEKVKFNDDFSLGNHLGLVIKKLPFYGKFQHSSKVISALSTNIE